MPEDKVTIAIVGKDAASKALRAVSGSLGKLGAAAKRAAGMAKAAFKAMILPIVAVTAVIGGLTFAAAGFESRMANVYTLLDMGPKKFRAMSKEVLTLSTIVPQAAKLLSDGLYDIVSAGVDASKALNVLGMSAKAGAAGITDTRTAAKAAMATINAFLLPLEDLQRVYDIQFLTVKRGVLTYAELAASIGMVIPAAKAAQQRIEEMYASIAFLTKQGLDASMATVALARSYEVLTRAEFSKKLDVMGIRVFDMTGNFRSLLDVLGDLHKRMTGAMGREVAVMINELFPEARARRAIIALLSQTRTVKSMVREMEVGAGTMEAAYKKIAETFNAQFQLMKNAVMRLIINLGEPMLKPMKAITKQITEWATKLGDIDWVAFWERFNKGAKEAREAITKIGDMFKAGGVIREAIDAWWEWFKTLAIGMAKIIWAPLETGFGIMLERLIITAKIGFADMISAIMEPFARIGGPFAPEALGIQAAMGGMKSAALSKMIELEESIPQRWADTYQDMTDQIEKLRSEMPHHGERIKEKITDLIDATVAAFAIPEPVAAPARRGRPGIMEAAGITKVWTPEGETLTGEAAKRYLAEYRQRLEDTAKEQRKEGEATVTALRGMSTEQLKLWNISYETRQKLLKLTEEFRNQRAAQEAVQASLVR